LVGIGEPGDDFGAGAGVVVVGWDLVLDAGVIGLTPTGLPEATVEWRGGLGMDVPEATVEVPCRRCIMILTISLCSNRDASSVKRLLASFSFAKASAASEACREKYNVSKHLFGACTSLRRNKDGYAYKDTRGDIA